MTDFDPNDPLTFRGWRPKTPSGWGVWIFLGCCVLAVLAVRLLARLVS